MTAFRSSHRYHDLPIVCHRCLEPNLNDGLLLMAKRIGAYILKMYVTTVLPSYATGCSQHGSSDLKAVIDPVIERNADLIRSSAKYSLVYDY